MDFTVIISDRKPRKRVQVSVSRLALETGYHKSHISRIFRGETRPSFRCLTKLASALDVTVDELATTLTENKTKRKSVLTRGLR